ncbi:hypothetical protein AC1031_013575 [Aphanomyces cochlioides]|nr:hypothetical protein AC1031_013575 [Aphanomyces cochlioides]
MVESPSSSSYTSEWGFFAAHETPTKHSFHDHPLKDLRTIPSPQLRPLRTIRRATTCLYQLGDLPPIVPPLPKHTRVHVDLPPLPNHPLRDHTTGRLLEKVGVLKYNHQQVVVSLRHQYLSWVPVKDKTFEPLKNKPKQSVLVLQDAHVEFSMRHSRCSWWTLTTAHGRWRFECPSAGACAAWVHTLERVIASLEPSSPLPPSRAMSAPIRIVRRDKL